jgi:putative PIN family toxin of toxin-antitoxin system
MVQRKKRIPVVADTNVFVRNFKSRDASNANRRVIRLWLLEKRLQLIASPELIAEYLEVFEEVLGMDAETVGEWRLRFEHDPRCDLVNLARRYTESRDPDDNLLLATALAGRVEYLITNDRDLLDLPDDFKRTIPFAILTPQEFLRQFEAAA